MSLLWMDNFEGYIPPSTNLLPASATTWLNAEYEIIGNINQRWRLGIAQSPMINGSMRVGLYSNYVGSTNPNLSTTIESRSAFAVLYNVCKGIEYGEPVHFSYKLINYKITSESITPQFAIVNGPRGATKHIILVIRMTLNSMTIYYNNGEERISIARPIVLFGTHDTIECRIVKDSNTPNNLSSFSIWVNNKLIYSGDILNNFGNIEDTQFMVMGGCRLLPASSNGTLGAWTSNLSTPITENIISYAAVPADYYVTDFTVNNERGLYNNNRLGKVRVLMRKPVEDEGPNEFLKSPAAEGEPSHADVVNVIPPDLDMYLETPADQATEMYGADLFDNLGTEDIRASAIRIIGSKQDPAGYNLMPVYKLGLLTYEMEPTSLRMEPSIALTIHEVNPATDTPWQASVLNAAKFGVKSTTD